MALQLFWRPYGESNITTLGFYELFNELYPEYSDDILIVVRNFDEFIHTIFLSHDGVADIDGALYWTKPLKDFRVSVALRSGSNGIFPDAFLLAEGLAPVDPAVIEVMIELITNEIGSNLLLNVKTSIDDNYLEKTVNFYIDPYIEVTNNFEKNQLGIFIYLLYLKKKFANNSNVCVIISDLKPLIKRCKEIENDIALMSEKEFATKYSSLQVKYDTMKQSYTESKIYFFRILVLMNLLTASGPYVSGTETAEGLSVEPSKSFRILYDRCKTSKARYSVSFASVYSMSEGNQTGHGTILIVDNVERIIERFDPNGIGTASDLLRVTKATDEALAKFAKQEKYLYAEPVSFCPSIGIQQIEHLFSDEAGYCVSWSIIYGEERLMSNKSRNYVANYLLDDIILKYRLKGSDQKETALNVEKWIRKRIDEIFSQMTDVYQELSEYLEIQVNYVEGKLIYYI